MSAPFKRPWPGCRHSSIVSPSCEIQGHLYGQGVHVSSQDCIQADIQSTNSLAHMNLRLGETAADLRSLGVCPVLPLSKGPLSRRLTLPSSFTKYH